MLVRSSTGALKATSLWSSLELALCTRFCVLASHVSVLFTIIPNSFVWLTISITSPSILNLVGKLLFFREVKKSLNWFSSCLAAFHYKRYAYSGTHTHTQTHIYFHAQTLFCTRGGGPASKLKIGVPQLTQLIQNGKMMQCHNTVVLCLSYEIV